MICTIEHTPTSRSFLRRRSGQQTAARRVFLRSAALLMLVVAAAPLRIRAQVTVQDSHTTASLRGVDAGTAGVAWASGSGGTVLRTLDGGANWKTCATPKGAEKLDFRGVQALDASTALVMSSGKNELSKIFKTTDGCVTWKLVFTNPDVDGFFDSIRRVTSRQFYVLGDPVKGKFVLFLSRDTGETWFQVDDPGLDAEAGDGAFAASNTSLLALGATLYFGTGGTNLPQVYRTRAVCAPGAGQASCPVAWERRTVPLASYTSASGVFSLAGRTEMVAGKMAQVLIAVGGTYDKPLARDGLAAVSTNGGETWTVASTAPGGYRSAVAFDREARVWVTVGTNGMDVSRDDGRTWKAVQGAEGAGWNAIALPYVVGSKGRIGKLDLNATDR